MNNKHYDSLMKSNALDDNLARRIEVSDTPTHSHTRIYTMTTQ